MLNPEGSIPIEIHAAAPPDAISFIVARKSEIVVFPDGTQKKVWLESEEEWARKCGMIVGLARTL
jgi:hypothetical protein